MTMFRDIDAGGLRRYATALDLLHAARVGVDGYVRVATEALKTLCEAEAVAFSERDWSATGRRRPLDGFRSIWSEPIGDYAALMRGVAEVCEGGSAWTCAANGAVQRLSDSFSLPRLRNHAVYCEGLRHLGVCYNLNFGFTVQDTIDVQFGIARGPGRDFGETERALAASFVPHLRRSYELAVLRSWRRCDAARHAAHAAVALTSRQREVLRWMLDGKSNELIGEILGISVETVKIHLRRIYSALGVGTRVAAALKTIAAVPGYLPAAGAAEIGWPN